MTAALIGTLIALILIAFFVVPVAIAISTINEDRREREKSTRSADDNNNTGEVL